MEPYDLKALDRDTLEFVYRDHITADFPPAERKPLRSMQELMAAGRYDALGMYGGETLLSYALLWHDPEEGVVLLDYLGVLRDQPRGAGFGSAMLGLLAERYRRAKGILVEAEAVEKRASADENALRARRLAFYRRFGFRDLNYRARIFGVEYAMLYLGDGTEEEVMEAHQRLYHYEFSPWLYRRFIKIPYEPREKEQS